MDPLRVDLPVRDPVLVLERDPSGPLVTQRGDDEELLHNCDAGERFIGQRCGSAGRELLQQAGFGELPLRRAK